VFHALITAIVVTYGRPFSGNRGIGKLPVDMIPDEHRTLHDKLMLLRNQVYAHTDSKTDPNLATISINSLIFRSHDGEIEFGLQELKPEEHPVKGIMKLASALEKKTGYHMDKVLSRVKKHRLPDGEYLLNMDPDVDEWFVPRQTMMNESASEKQVVWDRPLLVGIACHAVLLGIWWFVFSFATVFVGNLLADGTFGWWPWPAKLHFAVFRAFDQINHVLTPAVLAVACLLVDIKMTTVLAQSKGPLSARKWSEWVTRGMVLLISFNVIALVSPIIRAVNVEIVR